MKEITSPDIAPSLPEKISYSWTTETLNIHLSKALEDLRQSTREHFKSYELHYTKTIEEHDRMYQQRFEAQQLALQAALISAEKAVAVAIIAQEKAVAAALMAADRAVTKSETAAESRFASMNEFRDQLRDQAATFLPRIEFDSMSKSINDKISANTASIIEKFESNNRTFTERLDDLKSYKDSSTGKSHGLNAGWVVLIGLVSLIGALISIVMVVSKKI